MVRKSRTFCPKWSKNYANEFRGAAHGVAMSSNFSCFSPNFRKFSTPLRGLPDFSNFLEYCRKKSLTKPARSGTMARGPIKIVVVLLLLVQRGWIISAMPSWTWLNYKKFAVFPQKRLDFLTPRAHIGLWYTKYIIVVLLLWCGRAENANDNHSHR